jgi:hypothetical protein
MNKLLSISILIVISMVFTFCSSNSAETTPEDTTPEETTLTDSSIELITIGHDSIGYTILAPKNSEVSTFPDYNFTTSLVSDDKSNRIHIVVKPVEGIETLEDLKGFLTFQLKNDVTPTQTEKGFIAISEESHSVTIFHKVEGVMVQVIAAPDQKAIAEEIAMSITVTE